MSVYINNYYDGSQNLTGTCELDGLDPHQGAVLPLQSNSNYNNPYYYWPSILMYYEFEDNKTLNGTNGELINYHPITEKIYQGKISSNGLNFSPQYKTGKTGDYSLGFSGHTVLNGNQTYNGTYLAELGKFEHDYIRQHIIDSNQLCISFWIKINSAPVSGYTNYIYPVCCATYDNGNGGYQPGSVFTIIIYNNGGGSSWNKIYCAFINSTNGSSESITWDTTFNVGSWYNVVCYCNSAGRYDIFINNNSTSTTGHSIKGSQCMSGTKDYPLKITIGGYNDTTFGSDAVINNNFDIDNVNISNIASTHFVNDLYNNGTGYRYIERYKDKASCRLLDNAQSLGDIIDIFCDFDENGEVVKFAYDVDNGQYYYTYETLNGVAKWYQHNASDDGFSVGFGNNYTTFFNNKGTACRDIHNDLGNTVNINIVVFLYNYGNLINTPTVTYTRITAYVDSETISKTIKFRASWHEIKKYGIKFNMKMFEDVVKKVLKFMVPIHTIENRNIKYNVAPFQNIKDAILKFAVKLHTISAYTIKFVPALLTTERRFLKFNVSPFQAVNNNIFKFAVVMNGLTNKTFNYAVRIHQYINKPIKFNVAPFADIINKSLKFNVLKHSEIMTNTIKFAVNFAGNISKIFKFSVNEKGKKSSTFKFLVSIIEHSARIFKFNVKPFFEAINRGMRFIVRYSGLNYVTLKFSKIGVGVDNLILKFIVVKYLTIRKIINFSVVFGRKCVIMFKIKRAYKYIDRLFYNNKNKWFNNQ